MNEFLGALRVYFFDFIGLAGLFLSLLALVFLVRGPLRQYFVLVIYLVSAMAAAIAEMIVSHNDGNSLRFQKVYWTGEVISDLLLFLVVIVFTYKALHGSPQRVAVGRLLAGVVVFVLLVPFVLFSRPLFRVRWLDHTSQLLNFGAAIMNLVLWTAILGSKRRDPLLLTLSVGLGIMVTGWAISFGLRSVLPVPEKWIGDAIGVLSWLASVGLWCWAFRPGAKQRKPLPEAAH